MFASGDHYKGEVIKGVMTGQGKLECLDQRCYEGSFKDGKLDG